MTDDFSKPFRGVVYFGIWATDTADDYGKREALIVLRRAVESCAEQDMREDREVAAAIAYLDCQGHDKRARAFLKALAVQHPIDRRQAATGALYALQDAVRLAWGQTPARL